MFVNKSLCQWRMAYKAEGYGTRAISKESRPFKKKNASEDIQDVVDTYCVSTSSITHDGLQVYIIGTDIVYLINYVLQRYSV